MTAIEQYALDLAKRVVAAREKARKVPTVASLNDITRIAVGEISQALERLTEQGILRKTENVNKIPMYHPNK